MHNGHPDPDNGYRQAAPHMMHNTIDVFEQFAARVKPAVEQHLATYSEFDGDCPDRLRSAIRYSLLAPGKRLRPILVLSSADACGSQWSDALPAACAIEMVHTYSLIHDDLPAMDADDLRRGRPSCHAAFDEPTAILAGDALLARAFEIMSLDLEPHIATRCISELAYAAGASQMVGGQADDLSATSLEHRVPTLERIHRRKTGAILVAALRMGAYTADASSEQIDHLTAYGTRLGLAFQIIDDLLDETGDEATIGKRTQKDNHHGKLTFPSLLGIEASRARAVELVSDAIQQLEVFGERAKPLEALARFVLERNH